LHPNSTEEPSVLWSFMSLCFKTPDIGKGFAENNHQFVLILL